MNAHRSYEPWIDDQRPWAPSRTGVPVERRDLLELAVHGMRAGLAAGLVLGLIEIAVSITLHGDPWLPFDFAAAILVGPEAKIRYVTVSPRRAAAAAEIAKVSRDFAPTSVVISIEEGEVAVMIDDHWELPEGSWPVRSPCTIDSPSADVRGDRSSSANLVVHATNSPRRQRRQSPQARISVTTTD